MTIKWSEVAQLYPTLSDTMEYSPPGSSVYGIFQARVLEWGAIALSHTKMISMVIMMQDWVLYELCLLLPLERVIGMELSGFVALV